MTVLHVQIVTHVNDGSLYKIVTDISNDSSLKTVTEE